MLGGSSAQEIELLMKATNPIRGATSEQLASIIGHLLWPQTQQREETTFHTSKKSSHDFKHSGI